MIRFFSYTLAMPSRLGEVPVLSNLEKRKKKTESSKMKQRNVIQTNNQDKTS